MTQQLNFFFSTWDVSEFFNAVNIRSLVEQNNSDLFRQVSTRWFLVILLGEENRSRVARVALVQLWKMRGGFYNWIESEFWNVFWNARKGWPRFESACDII